MTIIVVTVRRDLWWMTKWTLHKKKVGGNPKCLPGVHYQDAFTAKKSSIVLHDLISLSLGSFFSCFGSKHGENDFVVNKTFLFLEYPSQKIIVVVTILMVTIMRIVTTTMTVVAVTTEIVIPTILVCWGYINKTSSLDKIIFLVNVATNARTFKRFCAASSLLRSRFPRIAVVSNHKGLFKTLV